MRKMQEVLGYKNVEAAMTYTHVIISRW
ncbi:hypothetical protein [Chloroherpeton thalassium]